MRMLAYVCGNFGLFFWGVQDLQKSKFPVVELRKICHLQWLFFLSTQSHLDSPSPNLWYKQTVGPGIRQQIVFTVTLLKQCARIKRWQQKRKSYLGVMLLILRQKNPILLFLFGEISSFVAQVGLSLYSVSTCTHAGNILVLVVLRFSVTVGNEY